MVHKACELDSPDCIETADLTDRAKQIARGMFRQYMRWQLKYQLDHGTGAMEKEEASFYVPETGTVGILPKGEHRDYSKAPEHAVCATLDIRLWFASHDVIDIKTGWAPQPPDESDQLRLQGLIVSKLFEKPTVTVGILALREHDHSLMTAEFSDITLGVVEAEVRRVHLAIQNKEGPTPGAWCKYCPINKKCELYEEKKR